MIRRALLTILLMTMLAACNLLAPTGQPGAADQAAPPVEATATQEVLSTATVALTETSTPVPLEESPAATNTPLLAPTEAPAETTVPMEQPTITSTLELPAETTPTETPAAMATLIAGNQNVAPADPAALTIRYLKQEGTPAYTANFVRPDAGCNWMGVAGQAFDAKGTPVTGLVVEVNGVLENRQVLELGLTGGTTALGPGGYVVNLSDHTAASTDSLAVQLKDVNGNPLSEKILFDTMNNCEQNLAVINFSAFSGRFYFPLIRKGSR